MKLTAELTDRERLDKYLLRCYPKFSRNHIQRYLERETITVNGKRATIHHWLKNGDVIEGPDCTAAEKRPTRPAHDDPIVLEATDTYAIVVKPSGILIHPTEHDEDDTLADWIRMRFPSIAAVGDDPKRPGIVHRLDRDVGGLVLIALDQKTYEYFKGLFQEHSIIKKYYCLVHGCIQNDEGQIDTPIERSRAKGRMIAQSQKQSGKQAITLFKVLKRYRNYTLLDVQILTGRTHQIRTHFYSIGHSIVGDPLYQTRDIRKKKKSIELTTPFLYAYYLSFQDQNGIPHEYRVDLPEKLASFLNHCL